jgi:predicted nucleic acid-binding protein
VLEGKPPLVLDASVITNLLGSGIPEQIIESFDTPILVAKQTSREIADDPSRRVSPQAWLKQIEARGLIKVIKLSGDALTNYLELVSAPQPDHLDDEEAATIALAVQQEGIPLIDAKRARRIYLDRYPGFPLGSTTELFRSLNEYGHLSHESLRATLLSALRTAKMRVIPEMTDWVIQTIGTEDAKQFSFLSTKINNDLM